MATLAHVLEGRRVLRYSAWDALLIALALTHGVIVVAVPVASVIALGVWWNANTISHYFIHNPFFRGRTLNALFSLYLSMLLGIPQSLWRDRHLAHHAERCWQLRITRQCVFEVFLVLGLWGTLLALQPAFFLTVYLPGYLAGLALCAVHGHYEHARGTVSHYGTVYNWLFFNDGYHVEHHARPGTHWTDLAGARQPETRTSRWPAVLRWLDVASLESLEQLVLRSRMLQRFVVNRHEQAFRRLLPELPPIRRIAVIGGGLFPRTVLILEKLLPEAQLTVIDGNEANIDKARTFVNGDVKFVHAWYDPARHAGFDLVVVPLSFHGDRAAFYGLPPAPAVLIHEWLWRPRGVGCVVSLLLLKRLNLVTRSFSS